ncbi:GNAT family N-acetyltransferase [Umezawaea tangerina]|uniref:Acetyltransferase (GNAT) family protein n=1 Tax=Umezawaea tangerina TaxID=84725 RepID=A0A2T0T9I7_9PSEU|nr:GNAT family N-acetyltransferase [Umezawaea tangerina]PRY42309.1 acetyltransferase (GNAT) family protein [Umezawaea tangerina]
MNGPRVHALDRWSAPAAVDAVFEGLSDHSRYLRFHSPMPRLTKAFRDRLTDLDGHRHVAVVAEVVGRPIGIARLVATEPGCAEIAVAVVDHWQRRGVGRMLLTELAQLAGTLCYTELHGDVLPENTAMVRLVRGAMPGARTVHQDGVVHYSFPVAWAFGAPTHEDLLAVVSPVVR